MRSINNIIPAVAARRSIRSFADTPVEREKLWRCVEAAGMAPSAENVKPCRFLIIDKKEKKDSFLKDVTSGIYRHTRWALSAPVICVLFAETDTKTHVFGSLLQGIPFQVLDIGIAGEHFVLQAAHMGIGTCWIGWFNRKKAEKYLKLPRKYHVYSLIALGYRKSDMPSAPRKRTSVKDIAVFNDPTTMF